MPQVQRGTIGQREPDESSEDDGRLPVDELLGRTRTKDSGRDRSGIAASSTAGSSLRGKKTLSEVLSQAPDYEPKGTFWGTIFNILSNIVGGGVLALPYAFANSGFILGSILVIFVGLLSGYAMWALMYCSEQLHRRGDIDNPFSYKAMMITAYGPRMGKLVEAVIIWYTFGTCVTYGVVTGESLAPLAKNWFGASGFLGERAAWTIFAGFLFAICSCARTLAELKFTSLLAFITIIYVLLCVIIRTFDPWDGRPHQAASASAFNWSTDIFKAIPLMSVSYGCHYNIPVYYEELKDRTPQKFTKILMTALTIIMSTYLLVSWFGYLHFGDGVPSYILDTSGSGNSSDSGSGFRFSIDDNMINIGRLGMFIHFAFVFPLIAVACRRSVNLFLNRDMESIPWVVLIFQSMVIVAIAVFLACLIPDIGVVLDFNGSLFGVFLIITFPGLLLIKLNPTFPEDERVNVIVPWILLIMGICFTVLGFTMTLISVV